MGLVRRHLVFLAAVVLCGGIFHGPAGARPARRLNTYRQVEALGELAELVRRYYYEKTDPVDLYHGAIEGYLSRLDPHSTYISPDDLRDAQERLKGAFEGIGIYFEVIGRYLTVLSPIEGSPAYNVGLLSGDRIVRIDGRTAVGIKEREVTRRLKGPKGSRVQVTVQREGHDDLLEFTIVRDRIEVPSVPYGFQIGDGIGYVKVTQFSGRTAVELRDALENLAEGGARKLILDLRNNGGGYLEQAVAVADQFIENGRLVVYTEGRSAGSREDHFGRSDPILPADVPLLVLVNSYSASASEIVAGAIQDYDRGLIVGETTFGKGLVQKEFPLENGGAVLLTIARYFTPSDRPIQRPYSRDRDSYVEAAHDGFDPNTDPDSTLAKPVYYTRILRRKVFGSGGITPDIRLERDSLNAFERRLSRRYFFEFANLHAVEITKDYDGFEAYFEDYRPRRREISMFKRFLRARDVEFTEREFRDADGLIQREIRRQVAQIHWGTEAAGRVLVDEDPEVSQAIEAFRRAEALLADRASHYNGGQSRTPSASGRRFERVR